MQQREACSEERDGRAAEGPWVAAGKKFLEGSSGWGYERQGRDITARMIRCGMIRCGPRNVKQAMRLCVDGRQGAARGGKEVAGISRIARDLGRMWWRAKNLIKCVYLTYIAQLQPLGVRQEWHNRRCSLHPRPQRQGPAGAAALLGMLGMQGARPCCVGTWRASHQVGHLLWLGLVRLQADREVAHLQGEGGTWPGRGDAGGGGGLEEWCGAWGKVGRSVELSRRSRRGPAGWLQGWAEPPWGTGHSRLVAGRPLLSSARSRRAHLP